MMRSQYQKGLRVQKGRAVMSPRTKIGTCLSDEPKHISPGIRIKQKNYYVVEVLWDGSSRPVEVSLNILKIVHDAPKVEESAA